MVSFAFVGFIRTRPWDRPGTFWGALGVVGSFVGYISRAPMRVVRFIRVRLVHSARPCSRRVHSGSLVSFLGVARFIRACALGHLVHSSAPCMLKGFVLSRPGGRKVHCTRALRVVCFICVCWGYSGAIGVAVFI